MLTDAYTLGMVADNKDVGTKIGEMAADYINKELGGKAEVVAFVNEASADMADRSNAMIEALKKNAPNATIVGTTTIANVGDGTAAMENYLQQFPDIKVLLVMVILLHLRLWKLLKQLIKQMDLELLVVMLPHKPCKSFRRWTHEGYH